MKDPTTIETTSRDEMICPDCYTEGLEEHKAFSNDYSGKAEILKATKCPNPSCRFNSGFPSEIIEEQYKDRSIIEKGVGVVTGGEDGINIGSVIINGIILVGVIVMLASFLGVDFVSFFNDGGSAEVQGQIYTLEGEPASGVTVQLDNYSSYNATTDGDGVFVIEDVPYGNYSVVAEPPDDSEAGFVEQPVSVSSSGVSLATTGSIAAQYNNSTSSLQMQFVSVQPSTREQTISNKNQLDISLVSPRNLGSGMNVTVIPLDDTQASGSSDIGMEESTVVVPEGDVIQSQVEVTGEVSTESFNNSYTYTGNEKNIQVYGNLQPESFAVELEGNASIPSYTKSSTVGGGDIMNVDVSGDQSVGNVSVTLSGLQNTSPNTQSGVYTGANPDDISIDSESAPSTATVTLTGDISTRSVEDSGTVGNGDLTYDFQGNIPAKDIEFTFTGGEPLNGTIDENRISATGESGTTNEQYTLIRNANDTTYQLELGHTVSRSSSLVRAGYSINGNETEISPGEQTIEIDTEEGDTVVIWVEARQENVPTSDYTHGGQFEVESSEVSQSEIQPGGSVGVRATIRNPSSSARTENIRVFKDGNVVSSERISISGGSTKEVVFDRLSFSSEGVHSIEISDGNPMYVEVGEASLDYGSGSIYGKLSSLNASGQISMDTTGDDSYDCQVSADGGSCTIDSAPDGEQSFAIRQDDVQNTGFNITYMAQNGAENITVDINGDGENEISHAGVLQKDETISESVTLSSGTYEVDFDVENGGAVPYELVWTEAGSVNQPQVQLNGETVINEGSTFKGSRTYTIDSLPGGENTFQFNSQNGEPYNAEIEWSEQSDETVPQLLIDDTLVCERSDFNEERRCTISTANVDAGQVAFTFEGGSDEFEFSVQQTARAVPIRIEAMINDRSTEILQEEAISQTSEGAWTAEKTIGNDVESGNNTAVLSTQQVNGMDVSASGTVSYTYDIAQADTPQIMLETWRGTSRFNISDSALDANGYLDSETTVTIPNDTVASGKNSITVQSENNGGVTVRVQTVNETIVERAFNKTSNESDNSSAE